MDMRTGGNLENLTVLDYFAAKAMAAMIMSDQYKTESEGDIAQLSYAIAEKMMEVKDEQGS
jgi:hypothetical protein